MLFAPIRRLLIILCSYVVPAYECYKAVERPKQDTEELRKWCRYWLIIAILTAVEIFTDPFLHWIPLYHEAKLAFVVYLWYPKTQGTEYVYNTFVKPVVSQREPEIDLWVAKVIREGKAVARQWWSHTRTFGDETLSRMLHLANMQSENAQNTAQEPHPVVEEPAVETESEEEYQVVEEATDIQQSSPRNWSAIPSFLRFRGS